MPALKKAASPTGVYVAQSSGVFRIKGRLYRYHVGETFPAGHPLLRVKPQAFRPVAFGDSPATADPEVRSED